ncbi:MAG: hypothetical protein Q8T08_15845 [Ignavibacteria bacterium]|nr:hypothetical protein [Ignavibacteria bacterium]
MKIRFKIAGIILLLSIVTFMGCLPEDDLELDDPIVLYLGTWTVADNETKINYEVVIERNPNNSSEVLLQNFAGSGSAATALVTGKILTITSPTIGNSWGVSGTGTYKSSYRIDFMYNLTIGGSSEDRFALFNR